MMKIKTDNKAKDVAKRALKLAWDATGSPFGMGVFQDNPEASEEDVWVNVQNNGDYPGNVTCKKGEIFADYVFGRMMKLAMTYGHKKINVPDNKLDSEFQPWSKKYPTYKGLIEVADNQLTYEKEK